MVSFHSYVKRLPEGSEYERNPPVENGSESNQRVSSILLIGGWSFFFFFFGFRVAIHSRVM